MVWRRAKRVFSLVCMFAAIAFPCIAAASEYRGQVTFGGLPLPGATVTVTQGTKKVTAVTDQGGLYTFPDLADGPGKIEIEMLCFSTVTADVTISPTTAPGKWELTLLPLEQITKLTKLPPAPVPSLSARPKTPATATNENAAPELPKPAEEANQQSSDGFLVNGSVNNAATSRFSLDQAFGNRRYNSKSLYTGGLAAVYDNSALDARPYSLSGLEHTQSRLQPHHRHLYARRPLEDSSCHAAWPYFLRSVSWTRNRTAETESGLVPTDAERTGDLSDLVNPLGQPVVVYDPATGLPFPGNAVPVSTQAQALLQLYPLPNLPGLRFITTRYPF